MRIGVIWCIVVNIYKIFVVVNVNVFILCFGISNNNESIWVFKFVLYRYMMMILGGLFYKKILVLILMKEF